MRVVVNRNLCESYGMCTGVVPEVFELGEDDILIVLQENPPEELRRDVEEAVRVCPKQALSIEDS